MTLPEFLAYISGSYYGSAVRLMDWASPERAGMFWRFVRAQYGLVGVGMAVLGLVRMARARRWRVLTCTALAYATYYFWGTVWYAYYNDVNSFIPNHAIMAIWIAAGGWAIWAALRKIVGKLLGAAAQNRAWIVSRTLAALLPMALIWTNGPQVDRSDEWATTRWGQYVIGAGAMAGQPIAQGATLLADREKYPPLDYFARVEKRRPDLDIVLLGDERAYLERLEWDMAHDTPVYLARFLPGLEHRYTLQSLGPLVRVRAGPETDLSAFGSYQLPIEAPARFGSATGVAQIELLGVQADADRTYRAGQSAPVTLLWKALWNEDEPGPGNYQVNLRLVSAAGTEWWSTSAHPVSGMYPTGAWRAGEVVADWHEVHLADDLPPGDYRLEAALFYPFTRTGLWVDKATGWAPLLTLPVEAPPQPVPIPQHWLRAIAPDQWQLVGYDLPSKAQPGAQVPLRLHWEAIAPLPDLEINWRVLAGKGTPTSGPAWSQSAPGQSEYPTTSWRPKERVITTHSLPMPTEGERASIQLRVRERRSGASPIPFVPRWLGKESTVLELPAIRIAGLPAGATNYADRILLLDSDLSAYQDRELLPGAPVELAIVWQAAQEIEHDYTLFVQLLAPDGTLKGQIDVWPKDGTHPTSKWVEGEPVEDRYRVYLDDNAPPGQYQVAVGWYLLQTMERLPVLRDDGQPYDDKITLPGPIVSDAAD
jgi:hypothetical protein